MISKCTKPITIKRQGQEKGWKKKLLRALVGFACVGAVFGIFALIPSEALVIKWLKYFLLVTAAALGAPALFKKLKI